MDTASERQAAMVRELTRSGDLAPEWQDAFLTVPRHLFIPETVWIPGEDGFVPVRKAADREAWLEFCYAIDSVVTQVDDGAPAGPGGTGLRITSAASRPDVVALMLDALDADPGMTVLEIGTGTGWNAALLAARLGAQNVTTIEVDPQVAEHAHRSLRDLGHKVTAVVGDGTFGYPPGAKYDRIIATVGAQRIPYAWIEQTRPGGLVVLPWASDFHNGALLSLLVSENGTASGTIVGNVAFMPLRHQRAPLVSVERYVRDVDTARRTATDLHPYDVLGEYDASLAIGFKVRRCKYVVESEGQDSYTVWFVDPWSGSWASLRHRAGADAFEIRQFGFRNLWDEVEAAYRWWDALGKPDAERWGFTVTPTDQTVWLDTPTNPVR